MSKTNLVGGVSLPGLLGLLFVALKLAGVITWSWWWVTLPFWGMTAVVIAFAVLMLAGKFLALAIIYLIESAIALFKKIFPRETGLRSIARNQRRHRLS